MSPAYTTTNYRKRKVKITKAKMTELETRWREHNREMKRRGMHDLRYDTLDDYIKYCYGMVKGPSPADRKSFKPKTPERNYFSERDADHKARYPSLMEKQVKDGTFCQNGGNGTRQETMKYTGTLIKGIATMHKSNAVPVIDEQHAIDIAKMRR